jgi:SRSO17 transposase
MVDGNRNIRSGCLSGLLVGCPKGAQQPAKYWLAQLSSLPPGWRRLVRTAQARWRLGLDCRELKEELGLDHYEGRHWWGWYHHVCLVSMAYAFLRFEQARLEKTPGVTLPMTPKRLRVAIIKLTGGYPWGQTRFTDSS